MILESIDNKVTMHRLQCILFMLTDHTFYITKINSTGLDVIIMLLELLSVT